jgi:filamentous hemagglutinin
LNPNVVGSGTAMDAARNEILTGKPTEGLFHSDKISQNRNGLAKWLANNPNASYQDRLVAQSLLDDIDRALKGC